MARSDPLKTLKAALTEKFHIDMSKNPVGLRLDQSALVIEGFVDRISQKKRALFYAMGLEGVDGVVDRLKIRPSSRMTDAEIKDRMMALLAGESALTGADIRAEARDGVIDLEGEVRSLMHKRLAGVLAWWIPGATDVINSLEVNPPEEDSEDEVIDAVKTALEKDSLVDGSTVAVKAKDWVVMLDGVVCSAAEKEAAEDDAWYVWGVNDVVNNIKVKRTISCRSPKRPA